MKKQKISRRRLKYIAFTMLVGFLGIFDAALYRQPLVLFLGLAFIGGAMFILNRSLT